MRERPNSAETLEGITHWWLMRHHIQRQLAIVERALTVLVDRGVMTRFVNRTGEHLYVVQQGGPDD